MDTRIRKILKVNINANIRQSHLGSNISATFSFESVTDVLGTFVRFESSIDRNVDGSSYKDISLLCFGERAKPRENARVSHEASRRGEKTSRSCVSFRHPPTYGLLKWRDCSHSSYKEWRVIRSLNFTWTVRSLPAYSDSLFFPLRRSQNATDWWRTQGTMERRKKGGEAPTRSFSPSRLPLRANFHRGRGLWVRGSEQCWKKFLIRRDLSSHYNYHVTGRQVVF